jgi:hypothetical protein
MSITALKVRVIFSFNLMYVNFFYQKLCKLFDKIFGHFFRQTFVNYFDKLLSIISTNFCQFCAKATDTYLADSWHKIKGHIGQNLAFIDGGHDLRRRATNKKNKKKIANFSPKMESILYYFI